jgi:DNA-binding NarL/FixJ family response regulator
LLTNDLASGSRVSAAAVRAGIEAQQIGTTTQLLAAAAAAPGATVILELAAVRSGVAELVAAIRAASPTDRQIIAFAPHVHEQQIAAARDAGCDRVLSRGQFFKGLDGLIGELAK